MAKYYGAPCSKCNETLRYKSGSCVNCAIKRARKNYNKNKKRYGNKTKEWAANNPDKVKKYRAISYKRNREKLLANARKKYHKNVEQERARCRKYREGNKESEYTRQRKWKDGNLDHVVEHARLYRLENRERDAEYLRQYRINNPQVNNANKAVANAVNRNDIPRVNTLKCNRCISQAIHYHHWSYKPKHWLDIEPLCGSCHSFADQERKEELT